MYGGSHDARAEQHAVKQRGYTVAIVLVSVSIVCVIGYPYLKPIIDSAAANASHPTIIAPDEPARRPEKFDGLYKAGRAITGATDVGVNYGRFGELLQAYATECAIASDALVDRVDRDVLADFERALDSYKTSMQVWQIKIRSAGGSFADAYVNPDLAASLKDRGVSVTNGRIANPDADLQMLWGKGRAAIEAGNKRVRHP
jgi:hypothetical protein